MMRLLLRFGAKTELQDPLANDGQGALHTCVSKGCGKAVLWTLIEAGERDVGLSNVAQNVAFASQTRCSFLARVGLAIVGASLRAKDKYGRTPLGVAMSYGDMTRIRFLVEAAIFRRIPVFVPALTPAISVWYAPSSATASPLIGFLITPIDVPVCRMNRLFVVLVDWYGWLWGLAYWVGAFLLVLSPTGLGMIPTVEKMQPSGFAAGSIALLCVTFHVYFTPYLSPLAILFGLVVQAAVIFTFFRAVVTPPRYVEQDTTRGELVQQILASQPDKDGPTALVGSTALRICTTCLTDKAKGSMHCSQCNRCVVDLDHHCPFVNNCVAAGNRLHFVQFLIAALVAIGWWIVCFTLTTSSHCTGVKGPVHTIACVTVWHRGLAICAVLAVMLWIWIAALFTSQVYMIGAATTTYDMMQGVDSPGLQSLAAMFDNVKHFFTTGEARRVTSACRDAGRMLQSACRSSRCRHGHHGHGHGHHHNHHDVEGDMAMTPLIIGVNSPDDRIISV